MKPPEMSQADMTFNTSQPATPPKRRLRLGLVGGGLNSFIGETHRIAARLDGRYEICAGALSSDPGRALADGIALGLSPERCYASWQAMLAAEPLRENKIDVLAILTPNNSHFEIAMAALDAGLHVLCEKPLTNDAASAQQLADKVHSSGLAFCVAYCYSGYPMVRQARAMVQSGVLGPIRQVHVQYVQSGLSDPDAPGGWRADPQQGGASLVLLDIGTHAFQLGDYVSGLGVSEICADVGSGIPGRTVHDYVSALLHYDNGARGSLWVTNAAAGSEHGLSIRIHGDRGGLEWHQEQPNRLIHRQSGGFEQTLTRRLDTAVTPQARRSTRIAIGHPEGYLEAFANLYRELADDIAARGERGASAANGADGASGAHVAPECLYPTVDQGVHGVALVEAALRSAASRTWVAL
jgi:predicted dehydrogenase